jgi:hypothetical protein
MADTVYLKDGQVFNGDIISHDDQSVVIDTYGGDEEVIGRQFVDKIVWAGSYRSYRRKMRMGYMRGDEWINDEWIFKVGIDFNGTHEVTNGNPSSINGTQDVNSGMSFSGEYVTYDSKNLGFGGGLTIQSARGLAGTTGSFDFLPIYALVKLRTTPTARNSYKYLEAQLGYNFFGGDRDYAGDNGTLDGGVYYGVGAGIAFNRLQFELLYTVDHGTASDSGYDFNNNFFSQSGDITYSKLGFSIGFQY